MISWHRSSSSPHSVLLNYFIDRLKIIRSRSGKSCGRIIAAFNISRISKRLPIRLGHLDLIWEWHWHDIHYLCLVIFLIVHPRLTSRSWSLANLTFSKTVSWNVWKACRKRISVLVHDISILWILISHIIR